ncbi:phage tail protein [Phaeobacter gallaeciensis]|uniref:TipJ family phage tail tip protein n=1 Tax=Phaeobacter gallaeciensis TaxID=60890 RepID=UPI002380B1F6|nr:phage tail protein [Phaeobacter gallaeciensis]MDE4297079.1 phage tail protein [Phaeobacter gallaeciensis]
MSVITKEIVGAGGGGKKGAGGKSADNTLRSKAVARIAEAISEGPIVGLVKGPQSIFFDETPLRNADTSWNFDNVRWQQRKGLPDDDHLNGHSAVETVNSVEAEVKVVTGAVTRTITDQNADAVRVMVRINSLFKLDDQGKAQTNTLHYRVSVRPYGGVWTEAVLQKLDNEKCTSAVQMAHRVELPAGGHPWDIQVERVTEDSTDDKDQSSMTFESFITLVEGRFTYPHTALVGLRVDAESMGANVPERAYHVMGRIISVPSNYDPVARTYTGIWDGTFIQAWTNNPAWIFYDLITNDRYGMGEHIGETEVAALKWKLYTIGQYCDQMIPSGFKDDLSADIIEPRFTFNGVIRNRQEAYHALQTITTAFRGMGYWALGQIFATADMPADPVKLVTPANVINGVFNYSSTALKARHSVAIVRWNDPNDFYRPATEMVINNEAMAKFGWREKRMDFPGCTSRGLAHRYGKWALDVENTETETVEYKASFDHMDIVPGDIIAVADPRKASVRMGGRVVQQYNNPGDATRDIVELDAAVSLVGGETYSIWLTNKDGSLSEHPVYVDTPGEKTLIHIDAQAEMVDANSVFIITGTDVAPRQYRVLSINEAEENIFQITALFHDPNKYARIEQGISFDPLPYSRDNRAKKVQNLFIDEVAYIDGDGVARTKTLLTWEAPSGVVVREYAIQADTPTEVKKFITSTKNTSIEIDGLERGSHTFYVTTVDRMGRVAAPATISHTVVGTDPIATGTVSNLALADSNGSTEFYGKDVRVEWQNLFPGSSGGALAENLALYDHNTVKIYHNPTNTLLRTVTVRGNKYTYSFDQNTRDCTAAALSVSAARSLRFEVSVTSKRNNISAATTLTVSNPVPSAVAPTVEKTGQTISVTMPATADNDVRGMKVWIEPSSTFNPELTTPKYDGAGGFMSWNGAPSTTYYVRAGYYDYFDDTVSVSASVAVVTGEIVVPTAPATPTGLALSTELLDNGMSRVTATWNENAEAYLAYYDLLVAENGGNEVGFSTPNATKFWDVLPGTSLSVRVRAVGKGGPQSNYTAIVSIAAAEDDVPPAVPGDPTLTPGFNSIWIEWAGVADADLSHYEVHHRADNTAPGVSPTNIYRANATEMVDAGLNDNQTRYYAIRAVDTSGNKSGWSALVSATTLNPTMTEVTTEDIQGIVDNTSFAAGVTPVEIVGVLPTTGNFEGRQALLTTNGKTYRFHNGAWTNKVETADLSGLLSSAQIQSLETAKLSGTIGADLIAANAVTAKHLAVADFTNINPDRDFADQSLWSWGGSDQFFYQGTVSAWGSPWYMSIRSADGSFQWGAGPAFMVDREGGDYLLSSVCSNPDAVGTMVIHLQVATDPNFSDAVDVWALNGVLLSASTITITRRSGVYRVPEGYTYGRIRYYLTGGATRGAIGGLTLRRMNNAELIVDGAISANHLDTNSVVAGKIAAGAVNAREIAAGAVTASKMLIADLTNLVPNGNVIDHDLTDYWGAVGGGGEIRVLTNNASYYETGNASLLLQKDSGNEAASINVHSEFFPIDATKKLYAETAIKTNQTPTSAGAYFRILFYDHNKVEISGHWDVAQNRPITTSWVKYSGEHQPPANAAFARVRLYNHDSQNTTNNLFFDRLVVRHMTAGELIVDGSIKASHVGTNEIIANAANIKNGVISNGKIANLDADKLTAGTALTNSLTVDGRAIGSMSRSDNLFDDMTDLWSVVGGVGQFANTNSASNVVTGHNSQYARDEGSVWAESPHKIAYDPSKLYKVTFRIKRGGGTNGGRVYLGVVGYKADKVTRVNVSGSNSVSSSHYVVASSLNQDTMSSAFVEYTGYITGHAAAGASGDGTINNPGVANEYVRYIAPLAIFNYNLASGGRDMIVDSVKIEAIAEDDAAGLINSGSTQVNPGKILISGSTTLSDWRKGGDVTKIDGGKLSVNTVSSNKITIGNRGITLIGIIFSTSGNVLSWTSGRIRYVGDSGSYTDQTISAGSVTYSGNWIYVYWQQGNSSFSTTTSPGTAIAENKAVIAQYRGGSYLDQNFGRTIIDGDFIKTGTIEAGHIKTGTITATQIASNTITASKIASNAITASELAADSVNAGHIQANSITASEIAANAITASELSSNSVQATHIQANAIVAGKIATGAITSGMGVFSGPLQSDGFSENSVGWRITKGGEAEFNDILVRGDLKVNSVSDGKDSYVGSGGKYINQTVATLRYDSAVTPDTIFNCGFHCEYRGMGNYNGSSVTHTTLYLDVRELNGSTWSAWSRLFTSGSRTSTSWGKISGAYSRMFNADKVELRLYASMNATADNTINNVRRIGLVLRTIPRR